MNKAEPHYAPGGVRDAFLMALERNDQELSRRLAVTLTTCGNPLPGLACDQLQVPHGSTYGTAARLLLEREKVAVNHADGILPSP